MGVVNKVSHAGEVSRIARTISGQLCLSRAPALVSGAQRRVPRQRHDPSVRTRRPTVHIPSVRVQRPEVLVCI